MTDAFKVADYLSRLVQGFRRTKVVRHLDDSGSQLVWWCTVLYIDVGLNENKQMSQTQIILPSPYFSSQK